MCRHIYAWAICLLALRTLSSVESATSLSQHPHQWRICYTSAYIRLEAVWWLVQSCRARMASFAPRKVYDHLSSIPRSYFLGHHAAGLSKMKGLLASIDLVIECRDYRAPLVSRNPLFEQNLGERPRLIVYTKQDLGSNSSKEARKVCTLLYRRDTLTLHREKKPFKNGMLHLPRYSVI